MVAELVFSAHLTQTDPQEFPVLIVGHLKSLTQISFADVKCKLEPLVSEKVFSSAVENLPSDGLSLWLRSAVVATLPTRCSRHNAPSQPHSMTKITRSFLSMNDAYIVIVSERSDVFPLACAVARALPLYTRKTSKAYSKKFTVYVEFVLVGDDRHKELTADDIECLSVMSDAIRLAARIVDTPCMEMDSSDFVQEAREIGSKLGIEPMVIEGEELKKRGFGGLYHVGKAAKNPPALVVLSHRPSGASKDIAWVGKGIVYDTGGLCIKSRINMCGMKRDCGGAAAVLGAFYAAVKLGFSENLHCILCIAENAVGTNALRPDDIIQLYSGRSVEINNTDAEGRLVLGDGVAYANTDLGATIVLDIATLTGAQSVTTGKIHGSLVTNSEEWEKTCVDAGKLSGDLVHPLIYAPELHFAEFSSTLADMKNSVADRGNAQVSCAAMFVASHLGLYDFPGDWIHLDITGPSYVGERATGYGVALMVCLFHKASLCSLIQSMNSPPSRLE